MKNTLTSIFSLLILATFLIACGGTTEEADSIPTDVAGLKEAIKAKKHEATQIQSQLNELTKKLEEIEPAAEKAKVAVETRTLEAETFESFATFQATVMAEDLINAASETGGTITSMTVREGDYVNKGQVIATVNLEILEKQKAELETTLSLAQTVFERQQRLWEQNIGSELQYLEAKNSKERLEKSLSTLSTQINKKNVYAPASGVVDKVLLTQGELASPGFPIVQILNTAKLKIVADLPETFLANVKQGNKVNIYFPAIDTETTKTITMIGRKVDPSNRTFKIEMATDNLGNKLRPNLLAEVKVKEKTIPNALFVPNNLLQMEVSGSQYIMVDDNGIAKKVKVVTGQSNSDVIIIEDGLKPGDKIITEGAIGLDNGVPLEAQLAEETSK